MRISAVVSLYISHKRALGHRFRTEDRTLRAFWRAVDDKPIDAIKAETVLAFLKGNGPVTTGGLALPPRVAHSGATNLSPAGMGQATAPEHGLCVETNASANGYAAQPAAGRTPAAGDHLRALPRCGKRPVAVYLPPSRT